MALDSGIDSRQYDAFSIRLLLSIGNDSEEIKLSIYNSMAQIAGKRTRIYDKR